MYGLPIMDTVRTIVYMIIKFDPRRKRKRYRYLLSRRNILDTLKYQVFGIDIIYSYIIKCMIAYTFSQSNLKVPKIISNKYLCIRTVFWKRFESTYLVKFLNIFAREKS